MKGGYRARQVLSTVGKRVTALAHPPLAGLMTRADVREVSRMPHFTEGTTVVRRRPVSFSDSIGLLHSVEEIFRSKVYQFKAKTDAPHIIDAGANIGLSVLFFKELYPQATIVAYEPDSAIFKLLERNTSGLAGVELRQAAAWIEKTTLTFYTEGSLAGSTQIDFLNTHKAVSVAAERLRDEIRKRPVDFLKIDIEGAENAVLFDIADDLNQVDHLFFEYHSIPGKPQLLGQLLELVASKGFRYAINGAHGPGLPFVEKLPSGFDLQLNVFCFRS